jgi:hypothetical protein
MLEFKQDDAEVNIIVTLTENVSLEAPFFLFVFTHVLTKDVVTLLLAESDDLSNYPGRYNEFTLAPTSLFAGKQPGFWTYEVYEQVSSTNIDTSLTGGLLENGKLLLNRPQEFAFEMYDSEVSYKTYNG